MRRNHHSDCPFHYDHHRECRAGHPALVFHTSIYNPDAERSIDLVILCDSPQERDQMSAALAGAGWGEWEKVNSAYLDWLFYQQWIAEAWRVSPERLPLQAVLDDLRAQMEGKRLRTGPRAKLFGVL